MPLSHTPLMEPPLLLAVLGRPPLVLLVAFAAAVGLSLLSRLRMRRLDPTLAAISAAIPAAVLGAWIGDPVFRASVLVDRDAPRPVDAVFVLSGDVDFHRTIHAVRVFRETGARWFVVSGAGAGGDSGALMADAARAEGVPESALVVETEATTTRENVLFVRGELERRGVRSVAVVTSPYHSRRAALAARHAWPGVRVVSLPVPDDHPLSCGGREATPPCRKQAAIERRKLAGYFARGWL